MPKALLKKEDYSRITEKDLDLLLKHLHNFEKKFPEGFAEFIKKPFVVRSLKNIQAYQTN